MKTPPNCLSSLSTIIVYANSCLWDSYPYMYQWVKGSRFVRVRGQLRTLKGGACGENN